MTYTLPNGTTMVLTDVGDTFAVDPMLIFLMNGKEVPVATAIPSISDIAVLENPIADGYDVELTHTNGRATTRFFYTLEAVASYILFLARHSPAEATPAAQVTDDTAPAQEPATTPAEPSLSAEEAAAAAGIFLEPVEGATEILICCGEFLESTKMPIMTITWRARATDFNLSHIVFRAWTVIDESDPCGYMHVCDRVKKYYGKYYPRDDFERMTLDILHQRYPNGEADIKDEFDERTVASMRKLEAKYSKPSVSAILRAKTAVLVKKLAGDVIACCVRAQELQAAGDSSGFEMELRHADSTGEMMRMEIIGYITVEEWDDINRWAAEANTYHGTQYWRYIANEYIRWADGVPAVTAA